MKPDVLLVLVCVMPARFQSNYVIGFTFAPHWFVKIGKITSWIPLAHG